MSTFNVILVTGIVAIIFVAGIWFTFSKFRNIESGETGRRKDIEEDIEVEDSKTD